MATDRAEARAQIARRGLTASAAELVVRVALGRMPLALVDRVRAQLRRFFSVGSWATEDDSALAAAVGPGDGWMEEQLDPELSIAFGWRGGAFRIDAVYTPSAPEGDEAGADAADEPARIRTLGDTFDEPIVIEAGRRPVDVRLTTGPGTGGTATYTREDATGNATIEALFHACPDLVQVALGPATLTATIDDETRWPDVLLPLLDVINTALMPPRAAPPDRQLARARSELGSLHPDSSRDLARILDATTSPDAAFRRVALERLETADPAVALWPWTRGLDDSPGPCAGPRPGCSPRPPGRRPATCWNGPSATPTLASATTRCAAWSPSASVRASRWSSATAATTTSGSGSPSKPPWPAARPIKPPVRRMAVSGSCHAGGVSMTRRFP